MPKNTYPRSDFELLLGSSDKISLDLGENRRTDSRRITDKFFRLLVESMNEAVFVIKHNGRILYANHKFCEVFGYSRKELTGQLLTNFLGGANKAILERQLANGLGQPNTAFEIDWIGKDGKKILTRVSHHSIKITESNKLIVGSITDITEHKRAKQALIQSEGDLRLLSAKLFSAQEEERKRIAYELHDGIGQSLSAIKFKIETIVRSADSDSSDLNSLSDLVSLLQDATGEVRRVSMGLRPSLLDDLGLKAAINWFCRGYQSIYPSIKLGIQFDVEEEDLTDSLKIVIYRIMQETLNNVAKHSLANHAYLRLMKRSKQIEFSIADNGNGFSLNEAFSRSPCEIGLGLSSMKERTNLSGGRFSVEAVIGKGTTIHAAWRCHSS